MTPCGDLRLYPPPSPPPLPTIMTPTGVGPNCVLHDVSRIVPLVQTYSIRRSPPLPSPLPLCLMKLVGGSLCVVDVLPSWLVRSRAAN